MLSCDGSSGAARLRPPRTIDGYLRKVLQYSSEQRTEQKCLLLWAMRKTLPQHTHGVLLLWRVVVCVLVFIVLPFRVSVVLLSAIMQCRSGLVAFRLHGDLLDGQGNSVGRLPSVVVGIQSLRRRERRMQHAIAKLPTGVYAERFAVGLPCCRYRYRMAPQLGFLLRRRTTRQPLIDVGVYIALFASPLGGTDREDHKNAPPPRCPYISRTEMTDGIGPHFERLGSHRSALSCLCCIVIVNLHNSILLYVHPIVKTKTERNQREVISVYTIKSYGI